MKKPIILLSSIIVTSMILGGCAHEQKNAVTHKNIAANEKLTYQIPSPHIKWDNQQALALDTFMKTWSKGFKPHRTFIRYFPGVAGSNYLGYNYPQDLNKRNLIYQGGRMKLGISKTGADKYNYNVVAIYSDALNANKPNADHLYLFTLHAGQPEVFVTTEIDNTSPKWLHVKQSKSKSLTTFFEHLVNDGVKNPLVEPDFQKAWPTATYKNMTFDYRQIGVMVEAYFSLSNTKMIDIAHEENFSIMHVKKGPLRVGYYNLSPKLAYTYDGKQVVMTSNDLALPTATIPWSTLIAKTYATRAQQHDVNLAAQTVNLKP